MNPPLPNFHLSLSSLFAEKELSQYDDDIQSESPLSASSPPADWKRTSKDYLKIAIIVVTVLIFALNVSLFKRFHGEYLLILRV